MQYVHVSIHLSKESDIKWQACVPRKESALLLIDAMGQFISISIDSKNEADKLFNVVTEIMEHYKKLEVNNGSSQIS